MVTARIEFLNALGGTECVTLPLSTGYGKGATAQELLVLALTVAEWALVVDASGATHHFPAGRIRSVVTWDYNTSEEPVAE